MAIFHLSSRVISRRVGRSATAAAAYRSGDVIHDECTNLVHDYSRKRGVAESFILAPEGAPKWATDRNRLWNEVELGEKRKDSQVAREVEVSLPVELTPEQQSELIRRYVREQFVERGMVADVNIHRDNEGNPHAHIMLTMREINDRGFGKKVRGWNSRELHNGWREAWAREVNRDLERAGLDERVDHRSYAERGIDVEPTIHEGPQVRQMEARGAYTERGTINRIIRQRNEERAAIMQHEQRRDQERAEELYRRGREGGEPMREGETGGAFYERGAADREAQERWDAEMAEQQGRDPEAEPEREMEEEPEHEPMTPEQQAELDRQQEQEREQENDRARRRERRERGRDHDRERGR